MGSAVNKVLGCKYDGGLFVASAHINIRHKLCALCSVASRQKHLANGALILNSNFIIRLVCISQRVSTKRLSVREINSQILLFC